MDPRQTTCLKAADAGRHEEDPEEQEVAGRRTSSTSTRRTTTTIRFWLLITASSLRDRQFEVSTLGRGFSADTAQWPDRPGRYMKFALLTILVVLQNNYDIRESERTS